MLQKGTHWNPLKVNQEFLSVDKSVAYLQQVSTSTLANSTLTQSDLYLNGLNQLTEQTMTELHNKDMCDPRGYPSHGALEGAWR